MAGGGDAYSATFLPDAYPDFDGSGLPRSERPIEIFIRETDQRFAREDLVDLETRALDETLGTLGELMLRE
jgi:hypothetical protein